MGVLLLRDLQTRKRKKITSTGSFTSTQEEFPPTFLVIVQKNTTTTSDTEDF